MAVFAGLLLDKILLKKIKQENPKPPNLQRPALMSKCCVSADTSELVHGRAHLSYNCSASAALGSAAVTLYC